MVSRSLDDGDIGPAESLLDEHNFPGVVPFHGVPQELQGIPCNKAKPCPQRLSVDEKPNRSGESHRQSHDVESDIDGVAMALGVVHQKSAQDSWGRWLLVGIAGFGEDSKGG